MFSVSSPDTLPTSSIWTASPCLPTQKCKIDFQKFKIDFQKFKIDFQKCKIDFLKFKIDFQKCKINFQKCKIYYKGQHSPCLPCRAEWSHSWCPCGWLPGSAGTPGHSGTGGTQWQSGTRPSGHGTPCLWGHLQPGTPSPPKVRHLQEERRVRLNSHNISSGGQNER